MKLRFLEGPGLSLDDYNKQHWLRLLGAAWGSKAGTVQRSLRARFVAIANGLSKACFAEPKSDPLSI